MKKIKTLPFILLAVVVFISCNSDPEKVKNESTQEALSETNTPWTEQSMTVGKIDALRSEIESLDIAPFEVTTTDLRAKIKQKWSKIHFYVQDEIVVKVKTYPHEGISKRTEEFYANKNGLLLAVIEDDGSGQKGKPKSEIDKMYYFNDGSLLAEIKKNEKSEFSIRESDAEELLAEFNEYIQIYNQYKTD